MLHIPQIVVLLWGYLQYLFFTPIHFYFPCLFEFLYKLWNQFIDFQKLNSARTCTRITLNLKIHLKRTCISAVFYLQIWHSMLLLRDDFGGTGTTPNSAQVLCLGITPGVLRGPLGFQKSNQPVIYYLCRPAFIGFFNFFKCSFQ